MASAEGTQNAAVATEEYVNKVADKTAGAAVKRYFTIPGRDPFEELEWEIRDAFIPGKDKPAFEQKGVEFPKFWSQTATNIVAQKYFRGRMGAPERESSVKQMIGRIVDTIGGWGSAGGYFASDEEAQIFQHDQVGRQDAARGEDGRPRRRPPRHRGVHLVQVARGGEGARPRAGRLRHVARLAGLGVDPVPEREQLRSRHRRLHGGGGRRRG